MSLVNPPITGPSTNPSPNAAPIIPITPARFSGAVISARYACAVEKLAPQIPVTTRAVNNNARLSFPFMLSTGFSACAMIRYPSMLPTRLAMITGLLPIRSDHRPSTGEKKNCIRL